MNRMDPMMQPAYTLEMLHRYPFGSGVPDNQSAVVRLTRRFRDQQYEELRGKVEAHSQLRHGSLIRIMRATVNRNARHFNIYYEYVPSSLRQAIGEMTLRQIKENQLRLFDLCCQLMHYNIYPEIAEQLLGITPQGVIKLYLDVDYRELSGNQNKQDLLLAKELEINSIFNKYITEVPSVKALRHYRSAPSIQGYFPPTNQQVMSGTPMSKKSMPRQSQHLRQSQVIEPASNSYIRNADKQSSRNQQGIDESFVHYNLPNEQTFTREQMVRQYAGSQVPTIHENNYYSKKQMENDRLYIPAQPVMQDHESHYTYNQQMGDVQEMPKIAVTGLRQTAPTSKLQNKITARQEQNQQQPRQQQQQPQYYSPQEKKFTKPRPSQQKSSVILNQPEPTTTVFKSLKRPSNQPSPIQPKEPPQENNNQYWQAENNANQNDHNDESIVASESQHSQQVAEHQSQSQSQSQRQQQKQSKQESQELQPRSPGNEFMFMDENDPLTKEFNNLFDSHAVDHPRHDDQEQEPAAYQEEESRTSEAQHPRSSLPDDKQQINDRVQRALEKSQAMLNYFYANNPQRDTA